LSTVLIKYMATPKKAGYPTFGRRLKPSIQPVRPSALLQSYWGSGAFRVQPDILLWSIFILTSRLFHFDRPASYPACFRRSSLQRVSWNRIQPPNLSRWNAASANGEAVFRRCHPRRPDQTVAHHSQGAQDYIPMSRILLKSAPKIHQIRPGSVNPIGVRLQGNTTGSPHWAKIMVGPRPCQTPASFPPTCHTSPVAAASNLEIRPRYFILIPPQWLHKVPGRTCPAYPTK